MGEFLAPVLQYLYVLFLRKKKNGHLAMDSQALKRYALSSLSSFSGNKTPWIKYWVVVVMVIPLAESVDEPFYCPLGTNTSINCRCGCNPGCLFKAGGETVLMNNGLGIEIHQDDANYSLNVTCSEKLNNVHITCVCHGNTNDNTFVSIRISTQDPANPTTHTNQNETTASPAQTEYRHRTFSSANKTTYYLSTMFLMLCYTSFLLF